MSFAFVRFADIDLSHPSQLAQGPITLSSSNGLRRRPATWPMHPGTARCKIGPRLDVNVGSKGEFCPDDVLLEWQYVRPMMRAEAFFHPELRLCVPALPYLLSP